jgi:hypothetical protein
MAIKLDLKNKAMNGAMDFWQRGTSFAAIANGTYAADRWVYSKTGTMVHTVSQSADVASDAFGVYSLLSTPTTAQAVLGTSDSISIAQRIEGNVLRTFKGKKMVLRFKVKAFKTGVYSLAIKNNANDRTLIKEYTVNVSDTWETKTVRFTHDSSGTWLYDTGIGMRVNFTIAAGASLRTSPDVWTNGNFYGSTNQVNGVDSLSNTFSLSDVTLVEDNEGQTRDPAFQYAGRDYFEELQLCQRYYETNTENGTAIGSATTIGEQHMWCPTLVSTRATIEYKVPKRAYAAMTFWNRNGTLGQWFDSGSATGRSVDASGSWLHYFYLSVTPAAINRVQVGHWAADAEL